MSELYDDWSETGPYCTTCYSSDVGCIECAKEPLEKDLASALSRIAELETELAALKNGAR